ncbi:MAG TPA: DUF5996 family protein [Polyangiaceae bacterium]|nr:DUF5996 family protein [Polyangiaceae bacterium]
MHPSSIATRWPELPYAAWRDTRDTLHLWTQVVGKIVLAQAPWLNHSWHVTLRVSAHGLRTPLVFYGDRELELEFDFVDHVLAVRSSDGGLGTVALRPISVADFHDEVMAALMDLGFDIRIGPTPNEITDAVPFAVDRTHASYDRDYAHRFFRVLARTNAVLTRFRTAFLGKASPVHFFWGSFDLAVTRFSGRRAPRHPGGVPNLPDSVTREAYSHEVSSAGFWPGGGGPIDYPAFYSYAYPSPAGFDRASVRPAQAFFSKELGEFILPYDVVRTASDPEQTLFHFLQSTYEAAADLGRWDRAALECDVGAPHRVRRVS